MDVDARLPSAGQSSMRGAPARTAPQRSRRGLYTGVTALLLFAVIAVLGVSFWPKILQLTGRGADTSLFPWAQQTQQTTPNPAYAAFATQKASVDPAFQAYYTAHAGATQLGTPLTPAFPTSAGLVQFFPADALLLPSSQTTQAGTAPGDIAVQLLAPSTVGATGVVQLPLMAALLKAGSKLPASGANVALTYVDLRQAAQPSALIAGTPSTPTPGAPTRPIYITLTQQGGHNAGHNVAPVLWTYINRNNVAPLGWQADFGLPLTEPIETTAQVNGATHHLTIQAFAFGVLAADKDTLGADGQPTIQRMSSGLDYLSTFGPPSVVVAKKTLAWGVSDATVLDAPVNGKAVTHFGRNFALTLTGSAKWDSAALWYGVGWAAPKSSGAGWAPASAITFTAPDKAAQQNAGLDMLSPDLAAFVAGQNGNMGVGVYDVTRNIYYGANDSVAFDLASASKAVILVSYLDWIEGQNRAVRSDEVTTMTAMIENSDNDAAQLLFNRVGYGAGQQKYLQKLGLNDYVPCVDGWGCSNLSPASMTHVLALLYQGKILTAEHRQLALGLLSNIETDQRWGVGDTAPKGATFYMKDGWRPVTNDNDWTLNTTGIVVVGNETYVISVFSQHQDSFDWTKVNKVCDGVGKALI